MFTAWSSLVLLGMASVFGYHAWLGWRTRIVRFPLSLLTFQEFDRDENAPNFWGIMTLDIIGCAVALFFAVSSVSNTLQFFAKPVDRLQSMNGCYEAEGMPDFMRPPVHWTFQIQNGTVFDRDGKVISKIALHTKGRNSTPVTFQPGIDLSDDEHKMLQVMPGDTVAGQAHLKGTTAFLVFGSNWVWTTNTTACR